MLWISANRKRPNVSLPWTDPVTSLCIWNILLEKYGDLLQRHFISILFQMVFFFVSGVWFTIHLPPPQLYPFQAPMDHQTIPHCPHRGSKACYLRFEKPSMVHPASVFCTSSCMPHISCLLLKFWDGGLFTSRNLSSFSLHKRRHL